MANFEISYRLTDRIEGGYTLRPNETWGGIDRHWHPYWAGWRIIDELKHQSGFPASLDRNEKLQQLKKHFFKSEFWNSLNLDKIKFQKIANEIYDTAVNMGPDEAVEFLQRAINVFSREQIKVDGRIGPVTIYHANSIDHPSALLLCLNILQGYEYILIRESNPSQIEFIRGWLTKRVST